MRLLATATAACLLTSVSSAQVLVDFDTLPAGATASVSGDWSLVQSSGLPPGSSGLSARIDTANGVTSYGEISITPTAPEDFIGIQVSLRDDTTETTSGCGSTYTGCSSTGVGGTNCAFDSLTLFVNGICLGNLTETNDFIGLRTIDIPAGTPVSSVTLVFDTVDGSVNDGGIIEIDNILLFTEADCDLDGLPDDEELDCNGNGLSDTCEVLTDPSLDQDLNGILDACEQSGPLLVRYPPTGRLYTTMGPTTWAGAQANGAAQGLSLATVEDADLDSWLRTTFDLPLYWIGYHDSGTEGVFEWASGRPSSYENWAPFAPGSFAADQDFVAVSRLTGQWNTYFSAGVYPAILETNAIDCDGDGVLDDDQIGQDPQLDCDGNGLIDSCEIAADASLDCDGNGLLDPCQALDPAVDINGDGLIDSCVAPNYCEGAVNSSGSGGSMQLLGTPEMALDDCTLHATGLPALQWSYFVMSQGQAYIPNFGGSQGILCVGAPIVRFTLTAGPGQQVDQTTVSGERSYRLDFGALPQGITFLPGETWNFQLWFRDQNPSQTSNTTDGISVMFR